MTKLGGKKALNQCFLNCTVASIAVSVFGDKPWGAAVGLVSFFGALVLCHFIGGEND